MLRMRKLVVQLGGDIRWRSSPIAPPSSIVPSEVLIGTAMTCAETLKDGSSRPVEIGMVSLG